jgi:two-component system chemotaxis response regulator CheB
VDSTRPIRATCPECRGPLAEVVKVYGEHKLREYSCLVGHTFSSRTLLEAHCGVQESILWAGVVALEEAAILVDTVAGEFKPEVAKRLQEQAQLKLQQAATLRGIIEHLESFQTGPTDEPASSR